MDGCTRATLLGPGCTLNGSVCERKRSRAVDFRGWEGRGSYPGTGAGGGAGDVGLGAVLGAAGAGGLDGEERVLYLFLIRGMAYGHLGMT